MAKRENIAGKKFGYVTAVCPLPKRYQGSIIWQCVCDCGNICEIPRKNLKNNSSCGCHGSNSLPISEGLEKIEQWLISNEFQYEKDALFKKGEEEIYVDFLLEDENNAYVGVIMYDERGHFEPVDGKVTLLSTYMRDRQLNKDLERIGASFVRIKEEELDNLEDILVDFVNRPEAYIRQHSLNWETYYSRTKKELGSAFGPEAKE